MSAQESNPTDKPPKQIHIIKMSQDFFPAYKSRKRNGQIRLNDRSYQEGDLLIIQEWSDLLKVKTGAEFIAQITNISSPPGMLPDHILIHARPLT